MGQVGGRRQYTALSPAAGGREDEDMRSSIRMKGPAEGALTDRDGKGLLVKGILCGALVLGRSNLGARRLFQTETLSEEEPSQAREPGERGRNS